MSFSLVAWFVVTVIALVLWGGLMWLIARIDDALRKDRSASRLIWRIGNIIAAIPCVFWLGIFLMLFTKYLYTSPDRRAITLTYRNFIQAFDEKQYATAYALMSPAYREQNTLLTFQLSFPRDWIEVEQNERRTVNVKWNKASGQMLPVDDTGYVLRFVKSENQWYMEEDMDYWLD